MDRDHFLQAAARITRVGPQPAIRVIRLRGERFGSPVTLRPGAVIGAPHRPKMPSPEVTLPGPFVTPPSPVLPVATRWLRTSADSCGVRARCSVRVRSRTGRLRRSVLSSFHRLTVSSRGKLSPEPLRLTHPPGRRFFSHEPPSIQGRQAPWL